MALYGFLEISKTFIGVAKITVSCSFSCPVSHFFGNFEVSFMVVYGFLEISKTVMGVAKTTIYLCLCFPVSYLSDSFEEYFNGVLEIFTVDIGVCYFFSFVRHFNKNVQI